jgi:hypothetical protein
VSLLRQPVPRECQTAAARASSQSKVCPISIGIDYGLDEHETDLIRAALRITTHATGIYRRAPCGALLQ